MDKPTQGLLSSAAERQYLSQQGRHGIDRILAAVCIAITFVSLSARSAHAQHGDWLLGSFGFQGASQPPPGSYYMNQFSYYHTSGSGFASTGPIKCGPRGAACLGANFGATGSMDLFIDANILTWTSPFRVLGANYGLNLIVPFAIVDASGSASLQPDLSLPAKTAGLPSTATAGGATKGSIGDIYVEPLNLGWHFERFDAMASSGFFAPSGPYNADAKLNVGFGHWTGVFGVGGVVYADTERTWSLSIYSHYLLYASQIGRNYTLGDVVPFEWGAAKTLNLNGDLIKQVTVGAIGYAQWQVTNNSIGASPTTKPGTSIVDQLSTSKSQIYAAGPGINLLTKYGFYSLRWYEEFGAQGTPSGNQLMFSVALPLPVPGAKGAADAADTQF
jgi:hypothetical protein